MRKLISVFLICICLSVYSQNEFADIQAEVNSWDSFPKEFVEKETIELKDYQGDFDKIFFVIAEKNIKNGLMKIIG